MVKDFESATAVEARQPVLTWNNYISETPISQENPFQLTDETRAIETDLAKGRNGSLKLLPLRDHPPGGRKWPHLYEWGYSKCSGT